MSSDPPLSILRVVVLIDQLDQGFALSEHIVLDDVCNLLSDPAKLDVLPDWITVVAASVRIRNPGIPRREKARGQEM